MTEALELLKGRAIEGETTTDFPPAVIAEFTAGKHVDSLKRAVISGKLVPIGRDDKGESAYAPKDIIRVAKAKDIGAWRAWDSLLFPPDVRQQIASLPHWSERELEALCQGVPPAAYSDASTSESEWQPIRKAISEACKSGQLHAEQTNTGNAVYGGQWRIERVSAVRWAIGMRFPWFPEWLARNDWKEIWARQDSEKLAAGRYTLREAAKEIARNTGERLKPLLTKLTQAAGNGNLPVYFPGGEQRYEYGTKTGQASQVRDCYEEAYWNDLNTWLDAKEPRIRCSFPAPAQTPDTDTKEPAADTPAAVRKTRTNKKTWDDAKLKALWDESNMPGVTHTSLGMKHGVTRQRIGTLIGEAKDRFQTKARWANPQPGAPVRKIKGKH